MVENIQLFSKNQKNCEKGLKKWGSLQKSQKLLKRGILKKEDVYFIIYDI